MSFINTVHYATIRELKQSRNINVRRGNMLASSDGVGRSEDGDSAQLLENVFLWRGVPANSVSHATVSPVSGDRDRSGWAAFGSAMFHDVFFPRHRCTNSDDRRSRSSGRL